MNKELFEIFKTECKKDGYDLSEEDLDRQFSACEFYEINGVHPMDALITMHKRLKHFEPFFSELDANNAEK